MNRTQAIVMLRIWHDNIKRVQTANANAANFFSRGNLWLGIPTIILTATVTVTAVTDVLKDYKWALAILGGFATILTLLHAFLRFSERSAKHMSAANEYGCLKRHIQQSLALPPSSDTKFEETVDEFRETFDRLMRTAPHVPIRIWRKAMRSVPPVEIPWDTGDETNETAGKGGVAPK